MADEAEYIDDEERRLLVGAKSDAARSFDQTMITLSAGALGLSLTFIQQLATKPAQWRAFLTAGWVCFGIALFSILLSFLCFQYAIDARMNSSKSAAGAWDKRARLANWTSLGAFTVGVMSLLMFCVKNFLR
jgi:hypothetical protein